MCGSEQTQPNFTSRSCLGERIVRFLTRCSLTSSFSAERRITVAPDNGAPSHRRRPVHAILMLAWLAFWLNTLLFPCCEALAAAFDDNTDAVSHSTSVTPQVPHLDETQSERPHHGPGTPCDRILHADPAIAGEHAGLPTNRAHQEWFVISVSSTVGPPTLEKAVIRAFRDYHPPPPPAKARLYLHTQRLLI